MDHFQYVNHHLHAEAVPLKAIADAVGTPVYVYSTATLQRHLRVFARAFTKHDPLICYAVKANANIAVIRTLSEMGAGADVVSGGELAAALAAGVEPQRIVFSGVGKSADELVAALQAGVGQINVESEPELALLARVALSLGRTAPVAIRVNPDIDALTHEKISTGRRENKFGIEWTDARRVCAAAAACPGIALQGLAVHIGSQLTDITPFRDAFTRVRDLVAMLRADGLNPATLDLGGGLGAPYGNEDGIVPAPEAYAAVIDETVGHLGCRLILEPGRVLVGNAGVLLTRVLYVKEGATRTFAIVDAGMNDLMRPALYGAYHQIVPERQPPADPELREVDIVGPVCETSDTFGTGRLMPPIAAGDLLAIRTAGAYGASMASCYNLRPLVAEVMVNGDACAVVSERLPVAALIGRQHLPPWLAGGMAAAPLQPR